MNKRKYDLKEFGLRVKTVRKTLKLSQQEFGEKLNISGSFISDIEAGKSKAGYDLFFNLSVVFNVNLYYLVLGEGEMFGSSGILPDLGSKLICEQIETGAELLWYVGNSPMFKHTIMGFASKFLYENEKSIKKDLKIFKSKKEKNHD